MKIRENHAHMAITAQGATNLRPLLLHYAKILGEIEEDYREEAKENLSLLSVHGRAIEIQV